MDRTARSRIWKVFEGCMQCVLMCLEGCPKAVVDKAGGRAEARRNLMWELFSLGFSIWLLFFSLPLFFSPPSNFFLLLLLPFSFFAHAPPSLFSFLLHSPGWPQTHFVAKNELGFLSLPLPRPYFWDYRCALLCMFYRRWVLNLGFLTC